MFNMFVLRAVFVELLLFERETGPVTTGVFHRSQDLEAFQ